MTRWALRAAALSWVLGPFACKRVPEPDRVEDAAALEKLLAFANDAGTETLAAASNASSAVPSVSPSALASASALLAAFGSASAVPSASTSTSTSALASVASASASAAPLSPLATKVVGTWIFSKFDLADADTAAKWKAIPPAMQKEILVEAPKASIEFTPTHIVSRLPGVPDKKSTWSVETELDGELTIKTSDDGRKKLKFVGDELRIVDVDKKDAFVSLFARKPK